jgi:trehalose synthase
MLQALVGYVSHLGIPVRWLVIGADPEFYAITKRLHNQLHGQPGGGPLGHPEFTHYRRVLAANAEQLVDLVKPDGLVLLHDPQTAGLAGPLARAGIPVVWRSHVGVDWQNEATRSAWEFLRPCLRCASAFVFSRRQYVPSWVPPRRTWIIPPSIDPFSAKNQHLDEESVQAILATIGVLDHSVPHVPTGFVRRDGSAGYVAPGGPGYLILAGPAVSGVADDPEGAAVYAECLAQWRDLPAAVRARVLLASLPLDDVDENAAMVNALQRHATVVAQKSLAEGFGLTVAEGMWKGRPVVGSAVGGILDQITGGTGVLLPDPRDLGAFGAAVRGLIDEPARASRLGAAGRAYVQENYLGDVHLLRYARMFDAIAGD